jgi:D-sedoheptulose 7-phosphate isomerase
MTADSGAVRGRQEELQTVAVKFTPQRPRVRPRFFAWMRHVPHEEEMVSANDHASAIGRSLDDAAAGLAWLQREETVAALVALGSRLAACLDRGGRILTCGNGGSMCDAMHFAEELSGQFRRARRALSGLALCDPAFLTCVANDEGYARVFARGVEAWGRPGDSLVLLSTSGNSPNVVAAAEAARAGGLTIVGLLGRTGGAVAGLCDVAVIVPGTTSDRIQEVHIKIVHLLIEQIERRLFGAS